MKEKKPHCRVAEAYWRADSSYYTTVRPPRELSSLICFVDGGRHRNSLSEEESISSRLKDSSTTEKFSNPNNSEEENIVNLTEKLKLSKFIEALRSDIRVEVKKLGPKTFKSAVAIAKNIDNALSDDGGELNVTDSGINQILSQQLNTNKQLLELSEKVNAISSQNLCVNSLTEAPATTSNNVQSNQQTQCQICGKFNHTARNCFHYTRGNYYRGNSMASYNRTFRANNFHPYRSRANQRSNSGRSFRGDGTVEAFVEVTDESSDQYISLSKSWQTRDTSDLKKFLIWLKQHSPFNQSEELISVSLGIVADDRVNCDSAEELGENAVKGIVGKRFADVTLKRKVQVFTLAAMENTKLIDTDPVVFNPNQLFHRIACVLRSVDDTTLKAVYSMNGHLIFILYSTTLLFARDEDDFNERY
ncbi:hypothetical protein AVEN_13038-1 [Araneus ventricosus]|uniref:CCHC-type domain-containing protein n=1 Tax=Araneus ventricosus TaxID=182803 RepID=A0A4Y2IK45_ARAVE|nr:hypothetical protein AVEN_13038-1 [Araneus ventricosus]